MHRQGLLFRRLRGHLPCEVEIEHNAVRTVQDRRLWNHADARRTDAGTATVEGVVRHDVISADHLPSFSG